MKQYVIIGNSIAAVGCIEGIRQMDRETPITVVSKEAHPVYGRPLISYYLEGKTDLSHLSYRDADFYTRNRCTVLYGKTVVKVDPAQKTVTLDNQTLLPYEKLCVATGSTPFVPPMEGLELVKEKYGFLTLDDALALEKAVAKDSRVLIVGAGLIGLKCAEGLHARVKEITVCDLADHILSSILDVSSAARVEAHLRAHGIRFFLQDSVARFTPHTATLKSGAVLDFDVLVLAVGVRPNVELLKDAGAKIGRGITVNAQSETSLAGIYAAGDCTETQDISDGSVKIMALLPNAYLQGHAAGVNLAGGKEAFDQAIPMNSIRFFGLHLMTAGSRPDPAHGGTVYEETNGDALKKLYVKDGRLVGFLLIGNTARAGIYTDLIRKQTPLSEVDFESMKKIPFLSGFCEKKRRKMLGGVL